MQSNAKLNVFVQNHGKGCKNLTKKTKSGIKQTYLEDIHIHRQAESPLATAALAACSKNY